jgi:hypothetical protein
VTYNDLIRSSLRLIGKLGPGRGGSAPEITDAQFVLNSFLDACNADGLNIYTNSMSFFNTVAGQQLITFGPGGTWNADRPEKITRANVILQNSSVAVRVKLNLIGEEQWAAKPVTQVSTIPADIYNDGSWPLANLYFYPIPDAVYQIELYTWQLLHQVTDLTAAVSFPPGYADFIRYNLAVRMAPEWNLPLRADVLELARSSKAAIESMNITMPRLKTEPGLSGRGRDHFNWLSRQRS